MKLLSIIRFLIHHSSNEDFIQLLTKKGVFVEKGTKFFAPLTNQIDTARPWMISIGEYCKITAGYEFCNMTIAVLFLEGYMEKLFRILLQQSLAIMLLSVQEV